MKKNEFAQIKNLDVKELKDKAKSLKGEIGELTMEKNMKKLKDLKMISKKRKDLAQILTVVRQKQLLEELTPKTENSEKVVVVDNSTKKPPSRKRGRTELSKTK